MITIDDKSSTVVAQCAPGNQDFVKQYLDIRTKEGRIYTDREVLELPKIPRSHALYKEWVIRKHSSGRLINYLRKKQQLLQILEVGCGNGWLSAALANIPGSHVVGIDINGAELKQAEKVFQHLPNLQFINTGIDGEVLQPGSFDIIVFAASIQYFKSLTNVLKDAQSLLSPGGEIHIVDTSFYKKEQLEKARERTRTYYNELGFPAMGEHYFHHSLEDMFGCKTTVLSAPSFTRKAFFKDYNPFYWFKINGMQ